ncbi:MAG: V-type ATP synthase subunit D [Kiritimatiellae bacterium]|nr:V-type ATP synthase subunit D [Kiritimatiellia bacterium]
MAKIKLTKTEMKAQTDALKRFQRFLPMLQLKKQQLQAEIAQIAAQLEEVTEREKQADAALAPWVALFAGGGDELKSLVSVRKVETDTANIAGVTIPVFKKLETEVADIDLFETPAWYDDAVKALQEMLSLKAERVVFARQHELVTEELTTTSQRVNLFEKVKIPACKENIRVIKIAIGDEQTAAVTRGKLAKSRTKTQDGEDAA